MDRTSEPWPGAVIEELERTGSTMEDARQLARGGCPSGSAVLAAWQEKGRGRLPGRTWSSAPGESMLATVVLRRADMPFDVSELPLRAGVAAIRAVHDVSSLSVFIKWPNDLVCSGRKLAGLLCESGGDFALIGMGANCLQTAFPEDLATSACSILQASGRRVAPRDLLGAFLLRLREVMDDPAWASFLFSRLIRPAP